jgi:CRISPR-associated protein Cmr1
VLSQRFAPATLALQKARTWEQTLGFASRQLRLFRASRPYNREDRRSGRVNTEEWDEVIQGDDVDFPLGAIGLPVVFHDKKDDYSITVNSVGAENDEQLRRSSPLWLRPVPAEDEWRLLTFAFQGRFLPDPPAAGVWLLPDSKAETAGHSKRELVVEQEDVTRLTSQWLEVMRAGGDFTTTIRD